MNASVLAAAAPPESFYAKAGTNLRINSNVTSIDSKARNVVIAGGDTVAYDRLLLATGAEPVRLPILGADRPHVHTLRSFADCRAIIGLVVIGRQLYRTRGRAR